MESIYQTHIMHRNKLTPIAELKPNSKKKIKITCQDCSASFERYAFRLFESGSFLCQPCALIDKQSVTMEVGSKHGMLTIIKPAGTGRSLARCECGEVKEVLNTSVRTGRTQSCGCLVARRLSEYRAKNNRLQQRENHPMWKGGVTDERRALMSTAKYKEWRKSVFERDGYKCLKCGQHGGELNAHHVQNYADNPQLATNIENGATLCKKCHNEFHAIHTRRNNNREQLNDFLEKQYAFN